MAILKGAPERGMEPASAVEVPRRPAYVDPAGADGDVLKEKIGANTAAVISWIKDYGGRCVLYLVPDERQVRVNGRAPHACSLQEGDRLRVGATPFVFMERMPLEVLVADEQLADKCVFCHGEVLAQEKYLTCPNCGAVHHVEHWFEFNSGMCGDCRYAAILDDGEER